MSSFFLICDGNNWTSGARVERVSVESAINIAISCNQLSYTSEPLRRPVEWHRIVGLIFDLSDFTDAVNLFAYSANVRCTSRFKMRVGSRRRTDLQQTEKLILLHAFNLGNERLLINGERKETKIKQKQKTKTKRKEKTKSRNKKYNIIVTLFTRQPAANHRGR